MTTDSKAFCILAMKGRETPKTSLSMDMIVFQGALVKAGHWKKQLPIGALQLTLGTTAIFPLKKRGKSILQLKQTVEVLENKTFSQRPHIFPHMWKLDLKDKCMHKYIHYHTHNMFTVVGLFEGTKGKQERKRMIVNNVKIHCICVGGWHNEMH
jgi:hypothetical protein